MNKEQIISNLEKKEILIYKRFMNQNRYMGNHVIAKENLIVCFEEGDKRFQSPEKNYHGSRRHLFATPDLEIPIQNIEENMILKDYKRAKLKHITTYYIVDERNIEHYFESTTNFQTEFLTLDEIKKIANPNQKVLKLNSN